MALFNDLNVGPQVLLEDVQGNILRGYSGVKTLLCFIRFGNDSKAARDWVTEHVATSGRPFSVTAARDHVAAAPQPLVNFMLTASGLTKLGCPVERLEAMDPAFRRGVRSEQTLKKLNDTVVDKWADEYKEKWDALLLVSCSVAQEGQVMDDLALITKGLKTHIEQGGALNANGVPLGDGDATSNRHEPFGYRDNVSSVLFSDEHFQQYAQKYGLTEGQPWDLRRPLSVVLAPDPLTARGFGSYFVFRKLKQDVEKFRDRVGEISDSLTTEFPRTKQTRGEFLNELYGGGDKDPFGIFARKAGPARAAVEEFVKARMMGRYQDGRPLTPDPKANPVDGFDFSDDRGGAACPFSAHVRKMNPRGSTGDAAAEKKRTIVRRGTPYGRPDAAECGLLFLCAQSDIGDQFEFHQAKWANVGDVDLQAEPTPGVDYVAGQPASVPDKLVYDDKLDRHKRYAATIDTNFRVHDLVTLRGAEYLFAPSLSGLRALAQGELQ